ncbi:MAG: twin-arginine translocation signal domain-containing protein [Opitutaceae bacterium]
MPTSDQPARAATPSRRSFLRTLSCALAAGGVARPRWSLPLRLPPLTLLPHQL